MHPRYASLPRSIKAVLLVGAFGIVMGAVGVRLNHDLSWIRFFDNLHWTSGTLAAAIVSWLSLKRSEPESVKCLFWISLGLIGYAIGQIVWDIQTALGYSDFPSPSDLFYLWLGPCVTFGLLQAISVHASKTNLKTICLDAVTLTTATLILILVIYLPKRGDTALLPMLVLIAYPTTVFAAAITGFSMVPALRLRMNSGLMIFLLSMCLTGFSWMNWNLMSLNGAVIDGAWFNVSFSVAIFLAGFSLTRWKIEPVSDLRWDRIYEGITRLTPLAAVVIAFIAVIYAGHQANPLHQGLAEFGAFIVVLLAVFRYGHLMIERDLLLAAQEELALERSKTESDLRIAATAFESHESMMITDADSVILRVNHAFAESTGYTAEEVVGQTPRLFKSGRQDKEFYRAMWETINRTGTWHGEIWDRRKNGEIYPKWLTITAVKGSDGAVTHYVGSHIDISERKAAEEKIQYLGFHDSLTRLPNRRLLMDRLHQALTSSTRSGRAGALLLIDLDNFKNLNDTLGHHVGDQFLLQAAQRLASCVREGDTVARLGGDEFVVLLENLSEQSVEAAAQTKIIGEKMLLSLSQPYQLEAHGYHGTASIGATLFYDNTLLADELIKQADIAMYQAKKSGRNTLRFFDQKMQSIITGRFSLEGELRKALENREFHLHYQIQVDSSFHSLGAEVLIRWIHPVRGMIPPAQFIPLAEETGLILPIGQWVLETACAQIKAWEQDAHTRELVLAVNVSAKQFRQADFAAQVQDTVRRHCINPRLLKLELTEGMLLEDIEDTIATMNALNGIGVRFSLDDFGTGYSSLQYLKRLPLDQLKIDQSFVRDIATDSSDKAIVRTIIAMAQSLGLNVIAEGVETEEDRLSLLNFGCMHFQGYLFSKPVPIAQFEALLKQAALC